MLRYTLKLTSNSPDHLHMEVERFQDKDDFDNYELDVVISAMVATLKEHYKLETGSIKTNRKDLN